MVFRLGFLKCICSPLGHGGCRAVADDEVGDEGDFASRASGDESVTPGKRFESVDGTVFGK